MKLWSLSHQIQHFRPGSSGSSSCGQSRSRCRRNRLQTNYFMAKCESESCLQSVCSLKLLSGSDGVSTATLENAQARTPVLVVSIPSPLFHSVQLHVRFLKYSGMKIRTSASLAPENPLPVRGVDGRLRESGKRSGTGVGSR